MRKQKGKKKTLNLDAENKPASDQQMRMYFKCIMSALCNEEKNRNTSGNRRMWSIQRGSCEILLREAVLAYTALPSIFGLVEVTSLCTC